MKFIRVIPCLLLQEHSLVKTVKFKSPRYIGDPINAVHIFNELEVDEIIFLDIFASEKKLPINYTLLSNIVSECFIPFTYGGGIDSVQQMEKLFKIGIEKIAMNSAGMEKPILFDTASKIFGSQSIIGVIEIKRSLSGRYQVCSRRGKKIHKLNPSECAIMMRDHGVGEIFINDIDRDGTMKGYDLKLLQCISRSVDIPVIACGGAGNLTHFKEAIQIGGVSAVAAGSLFVYYGKEKGVLINYPSRQILDKLFIGEEY